VPQRSAAQATDIVLTASSNARNSASLATSSGETAGVARSAQYSDPDAGVCIVGGSQNPGQRIQVSISGNANLVLGASQRSRLPAPAQAAKGMSARFDLIEQTVLIDNLGTGAFRVTGTFSIPKQIERENYGGYSTTTVSAENAAITTLIDQVPP
jgi:hypothetical protein